MLEVESLDVYYGAVHALKGVSLRADAGEIVTPFKACTAP